MSNRNRFLLAVGALAAIVTFAILRRGEPQRSVTAAPAVALATVRYGNFDVVLEESGYLGAPAGTTTDLAFPNPGIIQRLYVHVGDHVDAGEALAALDTRSLALDAAAALAEADAASAGYRGGSVPGAAVSAARDRVEAARARVAADRAAVDRAQRLYVAGVDALKDVEAARATLAADEAASATAQSDLRSAGSQPAVAAAHVRAASARAASAQLFLAQATLRASIAGYVTAVFHHPGEAVDSTKPIVAIGPPQNEVTLNVPGTDAAQMAIGNPVTLEIAGSQIRARGHVSAIVPAVNPVTQTATVVVAAGNPAGAVAGASVLARITVAHARAMLIPQSAIVADPQRGVNVVFVQQRRSDGTLTFVQRNVSVLHENGTTAAIRGLKPGDRVAGEGAFQLLTPSSD